MSDRIVKATLLTCEKVDSLSWAGEVFYRRLFSIADDFGRYDGRVSILRAAMFPLKLSNVSEPDVAKWLDECSTAALVRCYVVDGKPFIEIVEFGQRLRAMKSKWPADPCRQMPAEVDRRLHSSDSVSVSDSVRDGPKVTRDRVDAAHKQFCELTGQKLSIAYDLERLWWEFFRAGFTESDLWTVVRYLQKEIREERRRKGALKLSNLLQPDKFQEDLALTTVVFYPPSKPARALPAEKPSAVTIEQNEAARKRAAEILAKFRAENR